MVAYKKAALSLRELATQDREWLLKRLPDAHRGELRKMLLQLDGLGIPQGQAWLSALESEKEENADDDPESAPRPDAALLDSLSRADDDRVKRVLEKEPDEVVAIVLAGGQWPWSKALMSSYKGLRRQRLETLRQQLKQDVPEKITQSVLRALERRLAWEPVTSRSRLNGKRRNTLIGKERTRLWQK